MRLAITHPYSWPEVRRGAERIVVETARALSNRGHDVTVLTSGSCPGRSLKDGVKMIRLRRYFRSPYRHEQSFGLRIAPYLIHGRFDVVHSLMPFDALASIRTRWAGGHISVYEEMGIPWRDWWSGLRDRRVREHLVHTTDVYGCMSEFALDVLRTDWGRDGDLIPGGVRLSDFYPAQDREPAPTVLFSGLLDEPRKGLADLLSAAAILSSDMPNLQVWLSGPGDPEPMLAGAPDGVRKLVRRLPLGSPHEQGERYARAWVTTLPSVSESFGLVLVESLASGTPIVVVDDAAPPSLVTPMTGAVSAPKDPASLAVALRKGLDLAMHPETAALCRAFAERFDWEKSIAPLLERLYLGHRGA